MTGVVFCVLITTLLCGERLIGKQERVWGGQLLKVRKHCSRPSQPRPGPPSPGLWLQPSSLSSLVSAFCVPLHTPGLGPWGGSCLPPGESLATAQLSGMLARYGWAPAGLCPPWAQHPPRPVGPQVLPASPRELLSPHVGLGHCLGSPCWPRPASRCHLLLFHQPQALEAPPDPLPPPSD